jgi:hypothetical protein
VSGATGASQPRDFYGGLKKSLRRSGSSPTLLITLAAETPPKSKIIVLEELVRRLA